MRLYNERLVLSLIRRHQSLPKAEIARLGCEDMLASGAVITGGATQLPGMVELAEEMVQALLDKGPPVDLHAEFSQPFALQVLYELIGVPLASLTIPRMMAITLLFCACSETTSTVIEIMLATRTLLA